MPSDTLTYHDKIRKNINRALKEVDLIIKSLEKEEEYFHFVEEIPPSTLAIFGDEGQRIYKSLYIDNRIAGNAPSESHRTVSRLVIRSEKVDTREVIRKAIDQLKGIVEISENPLDKEKAKDPEEPIETAPEETEEVIPIEDKDVADKIEQFQRSK
jgi:hypothetical protein